MAKGYSLDLRWRVFGAWQCGEGSQSEIAACFAVSVSFVRDLSRRFRESGDVAAKPYGGGRAPSVDAQTGEQIKALWPRATTRPLRSTAKAWPRRVVIWATRRSATGCASSG